MQPQQLEDDDSARAQASRNPLDWIRAAWARAPEHVVCPRWSLAGSSRAGIATCFWVPEAACLLDAGLRGTVITPRVILLTHGHTDHSSELPNLLSGRSTPVRVVVPRAHVGLYAAWLDAVARVTSDASGWTRHDEWPQHALEGVSAGDVIEWQVGTRRFAACAFSCTHTVDSIGFGVHEDTDQLRDEFRGASGAELCAHKRRVAEAALARGTDAAAAKELAQQSIVRSVRTPLFAFCGDTTAEVFRANPALAATFPCVIVECTYLPTRGAAAATATARPSGCSDDVSAETAAVRGHAHWTALLPTIAANPSTRFVLTHFSPRYSNAELAAFAASIASEHANVQLWI